MRRATMKFWQPSNVLARASTEGRTSSHESLGHDERRSRRGRFEEFAASSIMIRRRSTRAGAKQ
ncbi:hypothetical protein DMY01_04060 [Cutibacterium avidum]|uniref:Uncharacterized protein n=1 Tax=Cutibacterium avidum TaxID=33010 RepID=A0A3E2DHU3_9ACTN|nr:hypothetical protein CHT91_05330 [Cutibacterium avidum]TMT53811.1 hypothetical protein DMY01_04060 [Cutibacterium avidum]